MPFRYGIAVLTELPHLFVFLEAEIDGRQVAGVSADHLPPKWFTKNPDRAVDEEINEIRRVLNNAAQVSIGREGLSVFDLWLQVHTAQERWGKENTLPPLLYNFGTSLIERALIDAFCRKASRSFAELLRENAFGIRLECMHPELEHSFPHDWLPHAPLGSVQCRHTVGLGDPLRAADLSEEELLNDGLPQTLSECITEYGLEHFKIKINSAPESIARLCRIAAVIEEGTGGNYGVSLDGNESFSGLREFQEYWENLCSYRELESLLRNLLFVEQPFHRSIALTAEADLLSWEQRPPIIIDESDADSASLPAALELGYAGTSHKNCKGVFHGIANACLLAKRRQLTDTPPLLMTGEDLSTLGPVSLLQDLAVQAALGNASVERNGHHYFKGLSFLPGNVQRSMLKLHSDLYHPTAEGWPALSVSRGRIQLKTVNDAPFGFNGSIELLKSELEAH